MPALQGRRGASIHMDVDCFYCQAECKTLGIDCWSVPCLAHHWGMPLSVNYEAKKLGVSRSTTIEQAKAKGVKILHVPIKHAFTGEVMHDVPDDVYNERRVFKAYLEPYRQESAALMRLIASLLPSGSKFERTSIDEAYVELPVGYSFRSLNKECYGSSWYGLEDSSKSGADISKEDGSKSGSSLEEHEDELVAAGLVAHIIRIRARDELGYSLSAGVAMTRQVAKLASALNKPNKLTVVPSSEFSRFMSTIAVKEIRGLGPKAFKGLQQRYPFVTRATTCGELRTYMENERAGFGEGYTESPIESESEASDEDLTIDDDGSGVSGDKSGEDQSPVSKWDGLELDGDSSDEEAEKKAASRKPRARSELGGSHLSSGDGFFSWVYDGVRGLHNPDLRVSSRSDADSERGSAGGTSDKPSASSTISARLDSMSIQSSKIFVPALNVLDARTFIDVYFDDMVSRMHASGKQSARSLVVSLTSGNITRSRQSPVKSWAEARSVVHMLAIATELLDSRNSRGINKIAIGAKNFN